MIKELYACLNVFYLKLFQYEKYVDEAEVDPIMRNISMEINHLIDTYDEDYKLSQMQLDELLSCSMIDNHFVHKCSDREAKLRMNIDVSTIDSIRKQLDYCF